MYEKARLTRIIGEELYLPFKRCTRQEYLLPIHLFVDLGPTPSFAYALSFSESLTKL